MKYFLDNLDRIGQLVSTDPTRESAIGLETCAETRAVQVTRASLYSGAAAVVSDDPEEW